MNTRSCSDTLFERLTKGSRDKVAVLFVDGSRNARMISRFIEDFVVNATFVVAQKWITK